MVEPISCSVLIQGVSQTAPTQFLYLYKCLLCDWLLLLGGKTKKTKTLPFFLLAYSLVNVYKLCFLPLILIRLLAKSLYCY